MLRRIFGGFGPRQDEIIGDWRELHNEQLHNLYEYISPNIIIMMKSRTIRWAGYLARVGETWNAYRVLGKPKRKETNRRS
jgi:hypothetical protein